MSSILLLAAFVSTVPPVAERDLAQVAAGVSASPVPAAMGLASGVPSGVTAEQLDVWWSEQGAALIAEAVRPTPGVPAWLEGLRVRGGEGLRLALTVSAQTTP